MLTLDLDSADADRTVTVHHKPVAPARLPLRLALGAAAGLLLVLAFPPYDLWWLAPVTVAVFVLACRGLSAGAGALVGLAHGLGLFVILLHWSGVFVGAAPWLLLAVSQAAFHAALGAGLALVTRLRAWPLWAAALFVAEEAARTRLPWGGFPWGRMGFALSDSPYLHLASVGGVPLMTFALALTGTLLATGVIAARRHRAAVALVAAVAALAVAILPVLVSWSEPAGRQVRVAVIQGNVPQLGLDFNAQREAVLRNHVARTLELADRVRAGESPQPDLVVWPENSSDIDPFENPSAYALIQQAVDAIGVPVLVGAVLDGPGRYISNTGIVWDPATGPGQRYVKRHPVPFGEYIPLRSIARRVTDKVDRVGRDFVGGHRVGLLNVGGVRVGDVICFEVGYDGLVRDVVRAGGQLIVVQTNNATFGRTPQTEQQLAMARVRAAEHGRTVLVAATSGVSAVIGPDGAVRARAEVFTPAVLEADVTLGDHESLATRLGAWPEWLLTGAGVAAVVVVVAVWGGRRRRSRPSDALTTAAQPADEVSETTTVQKGRT
jgi:apolipoprotein N-acyltransferase